MDKTMKRIFNFSAAIAVVLSFASCQQTLEFSENIVNVKVVTDKIIEPEDAVKTYMGENSSTGNPEVKWNSGDAIVLYEFVDDATEPTQNPTSNGTELTEDDHIAKFNIPLSADKTEGITYTYEAVYPADAVSEGGANPNIFKRVQIPAIQTAQFIDQDYSTANFDPAADILLGVPVTRDSRPTESDYLSFRFKRVGTIGKLTLKNLWDEETVSCVEISLPDKSKLSGYSKIDIKAGTIIDAGYNTAEKITVNVPHSAEASMVTHNKEGENIPNVIYFRCLSGTWATGTEVTVKVTTDKAIYTKTTALPRDYEFIEGGLTSFSFNMATAVREEISTEDYSGPWMIVSENGGTLYAMPAYTIGKNNIPAVTYTLTGDGEAMSADGLADCQYTITKITDGGTYDGCYTIQDVNGLYLYAAGASSNNYMKGDSELGAEGKFYWAITFAEGQYSIVAKSTGRNVMQYNSSSTLFSCYASATQVAVALFPWDHVIPAGVPVIQVSSTELALNADGTEKDDQITVTGKNLTKEITATSSDESWLLAEVEGDKLTVAAEENTGAEDRNATITLSSTGATDVVIEVTQDKASSGPAGNVLTFNFVTHPTGWPAAKASSKEGSYSYSLGGKNYTFTHSKSGDGIYCGGASGSSGYLMVCSGNSLGLPAIEGYRLAKVVGTLNESGTPSTKSVVSITDGTDVIAGGAAQTWNTKGGSYTYNLTDTEDNTVYYLSVGTANCQLVTLELTYEATVALSSIAISGTPTKTSYIAGESFDTNGLIATATYEDGSKKDVTAAAEWTVTPPTLDLSTFTVTVSAKYKGKEGIGYVNVSVKSLSSIAIRTAPQTLTYEVGDKFNPTGLVITRNYSNATSDDYEYADHESEFTFSPALDAPLAATDEKVTITYQGQSVDQNITVTVPTFSSLEDLAAADLTSGTTVKVSFEDVPIKSIFITGSGSRSGIYFDIQKGGKDIEIYCQGVPETWMAGGTVSGTMICPWKNFNGTWELAPDKDTWSWTELTYKASVTAPVITTQPISAAYDLNVTAKDLKVTATGNPTPAYQWYSNTTNSNENGTMLTGETNDTYSPSTSNAGTFYYYCVATNSEGSATSDVATITVNAPTVATLPFTFDAGRAEIESEDGMSQSGLGSDYSSSPKLKFDGAGDYVVINFSEAATKVTYTIKGNSTSGTYAFDVMESADGKNYTTVHHHTSITDATSYTDELKDESRYVKFVYTTKANGNVALGKITISSESVEKYTLTINDAEYGSITATVDNKGVASGDKVEAGKTVVLTANAESGYTFESWTVTNTETSAAILVTNNRFIMPASDVTVSATFTEAGGGGGETVTLFHETFGDNSGSAREWSDTYSVKSGISGVYSNVSYTMTNLKQGKNTTGQTKSGLNQTTQGTDAVFEFGPLNVSSYTDLKLSYYWKAASIKGIYTTKIYYKTSKDGTYTEVTNSAGGATTFVQVSVDLPAAAISSTLYLKIVFNTSNAQAIIDEVDLTGVN